VNKMLEHDMNVVKFARIAVERSKLQKERRDLLSSVAATFDPTSLQFMQSIGQAYRAQKDRIVGMLKLLHEAVDFEFCDQTFFKYEDVRVAQLSSALAQVSSGRLNRHAQDAGARGILAEHGQNKMNAVTKVTLRPDMSEDIAMAFDLFYSNGTLTYNIDSDNAALPKGVANLRVVSAQVFAPALLLNEWGTSDIAEVWLRRLGSSTCTNTDGQSHLFSHSATGYYSAYSAKEDPRVTGVPPTWLTQPAHEVDIVGPTPVGPWQISMPSLQTESARQQVQEIELHLFLSYVPCNDAGCGRSMQTEETPALVFNLQKHNDSRTPRFPTVTALSLVGVTLGSVLTISAVFGLKRRG